MPRSFEGELRAQGLRFAIVASRFNDEIVDGLLEGALECLRRHDAEDELVEIYRVPGAFEIASAAARVASTHRHDAIITLGALIRGETPHFDFISMQTTLDISRVSIDASIPIAFGVITCNTMQQARDRIAHGSNKGWEAALAAIEMANLFRIVR